MQNSPNTQYPKDNRKKRNKGNLIFTACVISAVAIAAAAILVAMALVGRTPSDETPENEGQASGASSAVASETGSMLVSEPSSAASETSSVPASEPSSAASENTSSTIQMEGALSTLRQSDDRLLTIVNNTMSLPDGFKTNLTNAFDAKIDKAMVDDFEALYSAGAKENHYYWITYAYRSASAQQKIYDSTVDSLVESGMTKTEAQAEADRTIQKGGASEYVTGLSIGVNTGDDAFGKTEEYTWLVENGPKYGFVLRYPKDKEDITGVEYQPWRFRYVGKTHAKKMQELNLCLEEYVAYLQNQNDASSNANSTASQS